MNAQQLAKQAAKHQQLAARKDLLVAAHIGTPTYVCEVGVGTPDLCHVHNWIENAPVLLIDANLQCCLQCKERWRDAVSVYPTAIVADDREMVTMIGPSIEAFGSGYVEGEQAPAIQMKDDDGWTARIEVPATRFSQLDPGNIDYLSLDLEGCEYYVLATMVSRPKLIFAEMKARHYINPYLVEIEEWMRVEGYKRLALPINHLGSDWGWARK